MEIFLDTCGNFCILIGMTKNQELEALRKFVQFLGEDSYLGPVLSEEFASIETDIRSDFIPQGFVSRYKEHLRVAEAMAVEAKAKRVRELEVAEADLKRRIEASLFNLVNAREAARKLYSDAVTLHSRLNSDVDNFRAILNK